MFRGLSVLCPDLCVESQTKDCMGGYCWQQEGRGHVDLAERGVYFVCPGGIFWCGLLPSACFSTVTDGPQRVDFIFWNSP